MLSEQLQEALQSRATIDQAIGIILSQRRVSVEDAFAILRRASQTQNVKLRDVAGRLVAGTASPAAVGRQQPRR